MQLLRRRTMRNKNSNDIDDYLETRLLEWAEWLSTGNHFNIGYQRESSIAMFSEGKSICRNDKAIKTNVDTNEQAEQIEKMVCEMAQYKPIMSDCLRHQYLHQKSLRDSAKKLGISHTQYKLYVQMAKLWLVGRLSY
jgi:DNA-directed RNA polymerase specialized sigma subunit